MNLTPKQRHTLTAIRNFYTAEKRWPTLPEIRDRMGLTHREAHGRLRAYVGKGWLHSVYPRQWAAESEYVLTADGERALTERKR